MTDTLQATDDQAASVATAPRISKEYIEDMIAEEWYMTGDVFVDACQGFQGNTQQYGHLTLCMLRCANGFMVVGESAPMNPANFNEELGRKLAYENAFRKLWPLFAFARMQDELLHDKGN